MPDYTTLDRTTAAYSGRWGKRGKFQRVRIWPPTNPVGGGNVSGYLAPPWRVVFFKHGGGKMNPDDLDLGSNSTALYLANTLGCAVISYDTTPGGFYEPGAVEPEAKYWPETHEEDAAFIAWIRSRATDTALFGAGGSISTLPGKSLHWGLSSGGWDVVKTQLARDGEFEYASGAIQRGEARFARKFDHRCNFVLVNQHQSILSSFCKSKVAATDPVDSYTVNGAHSIGATSVSITGGTGAWVKGNRLTITGDSQQYAVRTDKASGAGSLDIFPALRVTLSGGETIERVETGMDKYGDHAWCGGYFFRSGDYIWQADTVSGASGAEFPWETKRQADADLQITSDNPRVKEVAWMFIGASVGAGTDDPLFTSALTGETSFRQILPAPYGLATEGTIHPGFINLHEEAQAFAMGYALDAAGNTSNVAVYQGNSTSNTTVAATNWNKGRNADFSSAVLGAFLTSRGF